MNNRLNILAVSVVVLSAPAAFAKKTTTQPAQTVPSVVYAKYDTNANGKLDAPEKDALLKAFAKNPEDPLLKPYDLNADGKLSDDELAAIPAIKLADAPAKKKHKKNQ